MPDTSLPPDPSSRETVDHLTRAQSDQIARKRKARNIAMLVVLVALSLLFYAISIVKMTKS